MDLDVVPAVDGQSRQQVGIAFFPAHHPRILPASERFPGRRREPQVRAEADGVNGNGDDLSRLPLEAPDIASPGVLIAPTSRNVRFDAPHLQGPRRDLVGAARAPPRGRHPNHVSSARAQVRHQTRVSSGVERPPSVVAGEFFARRRHNVDARSERTRTYADADHLTCSSIEPPCLHTGPVDPKVADLGPVHRQRASHRLRRGRHGRRARHRERRQQDNPHESHDLSLLSARGSWYLPTSSAPPDLEDRPMFTLGAAGNLPWATAAFRRLIGTLHLPAGRCTAVFTRESPTRSALRSISSTAPSSTFADDAARERVVLHPTVDV